MFTTFSIIPNYYKIFKMIGSYSLLFYKKYYNTFNNEEHDEMGFAERVKNVRIELKLSQEI